jgi:hypothetical protein
MTKWPVSVEAQARGFHDAVGQPQSSHWEYSTRKLLCSGRSRSLLVEGSARRSVESDGNDDIEAEKHSAFEVV